MFLISFSICAKEMCCYYEAECVCECPHALLTLYLIKKKA